MRTAGIALLVVGLGLLVGGPGTGVLVTGRGIIEIHETVAVAGDLADASTVSAGIHTALKALVLGLAVGAVGFVVTVGAVVLLIVGWRRRREPAIPEGVELPGNG